MVESPGQLFNIEPATGLLVRGININGHYLFTSSFNVFPIQQVDQNWYVQGGPRATIAKFGMRHIEGTCEFPIRIDRNGHLEQAVLDILLHTQNPTTALVVDTNNVLSTLDIVSDFGGTDNNDLLTLDCMAIDTLDIKATPNEGVIINVTFTGTINTRNKSAYIVPPDGFMLGRELSFADCNIERIKSSMDNCISMHIFIKNNLKKPVFILSYPLIERKDMPDFILTTGTQWGGYYEEFLRRGNDTETYIHGGFMPLSNLTLKFGPISAKYITPVYKVGQQPFTASLLKRKTEFFAQTYPMLNNPAGDLFTFI